MVATQNKDVVPTACAEYPGSISYSSASMVTVVADGIAVIAAANSIQSEGRPISFIINDTSRGMPKSFIVDKRYIFPEPNICFAVLVASNAPIISMDIGVHRDAVYESPFIITVGKSKNGLQQK